MKRLTFLLTLALSALCASATRYVGGDISLLPDYEKAGAKYKTHDGKPIADLIPWLHEQGMNAMRVRLFVNPDDYDGPDKDPNTCQTLDYIIPLCQRIKQSGMSLLLDFHYSDTWADPAKQWTPKAWANLSDEELYVKIYEYTRDCLTALNDADATPDFIQPGNEISYGMLWGTRDTPSKDLKKTLSGNPANWTRLGRLLNQAIKACREECPDAKIVIHTERVADLKVQQNFYDYMKAEKVDYDIIGLSYYPYFHGSLSVLENAIEALENRYTDKNIMIVETGFPYKWEVPGTTEKVDFDYSDAGQNEFARSLVDMLLKHKTVDGLFWWWLEYNAYSTTLGGWYNAPLFDSNTGRACSALTTICSFASGDSGVNDIIVSPEYPESEDVWHDLQGRRLNCAPQSPGIYIRNGRKVTKRL